MIEYSCSLNDISKKEMITYLDIEKYFVKYNAAYVGDSSIPTGKHIKEHLAHQLALKLLENDAIHFREEEIFDQAFAIRKTRTVASIDILDTKALRKFYTSSDFI